VVVIAGTVAVMVVGFVTGDRPSSNGGGGDDDDDDGTAKDCIICQLGN
jgi:hypothetical protein